MAEQQIKSKQRVAEHGEVMTGEREVNAMLDLVKQETERIESRFLEPACGDGNFLAEILRRKLAVVRRVYRPRRGSCHDYELQAMKAVMSIYGVELLQDNVDACRERLFQIFDAEYTDVCKRQCSDDYREVVKYVLSQNILCGNALSLMRVDADGNDTAEFIIFPEWSFPFNDSKVKRRDFELGKLMDETKVPQAPEDENQLALALDDEWEYDEETHAFIPKPVRSIPSFITGGSRSMSSFITGYNPDVLSCLANLSNDEVFTPPEVANAMLDMLPQELFSDPTATFLDIKTPRLIQFNFPSADFAA